METHGLFQFSWQAKSCHPCNRFFVFLVKPCPDSGRSGGCSVLELAPARLGEHVARGRAAVWRWKPKNACSYHLLDLNALDLAASWCRGSPRQGCHGDDEFFLGGFYHHQSSGRKRKPAWKHCRPRSWTKRCIQSSASSFAWSSILKTISGDKDRVRESTFEEALQQYNARPMVVSYDHLKREWVPSA